jgi:hypothetical protein
LNLIIINKTITSVHFPLLIIYYNIYNFIVRFWGFEVSEFQGFRVLRFRGLGFGVWGWLVADQVVVEIGG